MVEECEMGGVFDGGGCLFHVSEMFIVLCELMHAVVDPVPNIICQLSTHVWL